MSEQDREITVYDVNNALHLLITETARCAAVLGQIGYSAGCASDAFNKYHEITSDIQLDQALQLLTKRQRYLAIHGKHRVSKKWENEAWRRLQKQLYGGAK